MEKDSLSGFKKTLFIEVLPTIQKAIGMLEYEFEPVIKAKRADAFDKAMNKLKKYICSYIDEQVTWVKRKDSES